MKAELILIFFFISILIVGIAIGINLKFNEVKLPLSSMETGMNYSDNLDCKNTNDLFLDSQCLRHDFISFFKYNDTNNKIVTLSDFKQNGGVCWHSSLWYNDNLEKLGYKSKEVIIAGNNVSHQFTIGYDENITQRCIFDQGVVLCW